MKPESSLLAAFHIHGNLPPPINSLSHIVTFSLQDYGDDMVSICLVGQTIQPCPSPPLCLELTWKVNASDQLPPLWAGPRVSSSNDDALSLIKPHSVALSAREHTCKAVRVQEYDICP